MATGAPTKQNLAHHPAACRPRIPRSAAHTRPIRCRAAADDELEEITEECDQAEDEIDLGDFEDVSVELNEVDGSRRGDVMVWAGYMQRDLEREPRTDLPGTSAATSEREEEKPIYRDDIRSIDPTSQAVAESSASRFFDGNTLSLKTTPMSTLTEWDLRAASETKKWFDEDYARWQQRRSATIGQYPSMASDWRTDERIKSSMDPAEVDYKEWSMKEIWDLITMNGQAADPRDVPFEVRKPGSRTDFVADGYAHHPTIPEWLDMQGKLMKEDEEVKGRDGVDEAILASEFSDFDSEAFEFGSNDSGEL